MDHSEPTEIKCNLETCKYNQDGTCIAGYYNKQLVINYGHCTSYKYGRGHDENNSSV